MQMKRIPSTFSDLKSYLESYTSPLLEEMRMEMSSSLEAISTMPSTKISWIEQKKNNKVYDIVFDADSQNSKACNRPESYVPSVGDIIILSDVKPSIFLTSLAMGGHILLPLSQKEGMKTTTHLQLSM